MAKKFTGPQWDKINALFQLSADDYGLPARRDNSVVLGTFNIRKLGQSGKRSPQAWELLAAVCRRFDFLHIQEVMDNLEGLTWLKNQLGPQYGMVVSDVTGVFPGESGNKERLAFLFKWDRIRRTELASDITYDRSKIIRTLSENLTAINNAFEKHDKALEAWEEKVRQHRQQGKRKPAKPKVELPCFLSFIRQPHCASFQIVPQNNAQPVDLLAVNAHLLYGTSAQERYREFQALIEWLVLRAKQKEHLYHQNLLMMGDCNLEFDNIKEKREEIDAWLKDINKKKLKSKKAAKVNFPLLTEHPAKGLLRTNARDTQTYDQIALFAHDPRLPTYKANAQAGRQGPDAYDYGVFHFTDLIANALYGRGFGALPKDRQKLIYEKCEHDISDHMPAWIRLPVPGA